jgi:ureidoglycolate dehydrogenase (NAD+)
MTEHDDAAYRIDHDRLRAFARSVLDGAGVAPEHAQTVADALVRADLRGVDSHGVARLPTYVRKFEAGGFNPDPSIQVERPSPSAVRVDADDGPGQSAGVEAIDAAMEAAAETGLAGATVENSNHFGTAAYFTERASAHDFIGIAATNVDSGVVPYGGRTPFFGTNPIAISVPTDREFDITLDMATSTVAFGKIDHVATEKEDASIPAEWGVDDDGEPTTDPHEVAALRPFAGPKGYGLALAVDVLAGLLSGAGPSTSVNELYGNYDQPMRLGHFVAAIDVSAFRDLATFHAEVGQLIDDLKDQPSRDGFDEIMLPGEIEARTMQSNLDAGVPVREGVCDDLEGLAEEYDVSVPQPI